MHLFKQLEPLRTRRAALGALRELSLRGVSSDEGASLFDDPKESDPSGERLVIHFFKQHVEETK
jgi:hypothetical protein